MSPALHIDGPGMYCVYGSLAQNVPRQAAGHLVCYRLGSGQNGLVGDAIRGVLCLPSGVCNCRLQYLSTITKCTSRACILLQKAGGCWPQL